MNTDDTQRALTMPRRGLSDPTWPYRAAVATNIAETIEAERRRLGAHSLRRVMVTAAHPTHDACTTIARYPGKPGRIRGWLLACAIGLGLALAIVHWWSA